MNMKILEVSDSFYPSVDGPISVMVSLAKKFRKNGLGEVELLVPAYKEKVEVEGLKIHRCKAFMTSQDYYCATPAFDGKIKKLIKEGGYDIIHLQSPFPLAKYALKWGKKYGVPVVLTFHTKFRDEFEKRLKSKTLQRFMLNYIMKCINGCDCVTTVSQGSVKSLAEYGYKDCGSVKVIRNGTDMHPLGADPAEVEKLKISLGLQNRFGFLFVGRLSEVKNLPFVLKALSKVKARGVDNFKFVIVGNGEYAGELKRITAELGLTENVVFAGKVADRTELARYFAACNVLLFPSKFDTASITVPEAAANGLPTVMIKGCDSAEVLTDGVNGFLWEEDADVWAENLIGLIKDPSEAKRVGEGALKSVYQSWDDIARQYAELFKRIINDKKTAL